MSLVITGNPGVGKHTIADEILKTEDYDMLDINKIAIKSNHVEKNEVGIEVDVVNLKKHIKKMITKRSLIVGHLAPYVIDQSDVEVIIVLRKSPYKLVDVYEQRNYSKEKMKENLGSEILGIIAHDAISEFGTEKTFQIDITNQTTDETIEKIHSIIKGKSIDDEIDWLSEIKENQDLQKFFDY